VPGRTLCRGGHRPLLSRISHNGVAGRLKIRAAYRLRGVSADGAPPWPFVGRVQAPVDPQPRRPLAICTANEPTPPAAQESNTCLSRLELALVAQAACRAAKPEAGHGAGGLEEIVAGLSVGRLRLARAYSAKGAKSRHHRENHRTTRAATLKSADPLANGLSTGSGATSQRVFELRSAQAPKNSESPERLATHQMPVARGGPLEKGVRSRRETLIQQILVNRWRASQPVLGARGRLRSVTFLGDGPPWCRGRARIRINAGSLTPLAKHTPLRFVPLLDRLQRGTAEQPFDADRPDVPSVGKRVLAAALESRRSTGGLAALSMRKLAEALGGQGDVARTTTCAKPRTRSSTASVRSWSARFALPEIGGDWKAAMRQRALSAHRACYATPVAAPGDSSRGEPPGGHAPLHRCPPSGCWWRRVLPGAGPITRNASTATFTAFHPAGDPIFRSRLRTTPRWPPLFLLPASRRSFSPT